MAFVGFQIPPNSDGALLDLFNTTTSDSPANHIIHVEFDSFPNPKWDPPFEHVGINNNSIALAIYTPWNASLHSGDMADAWITYNATNKNLSMFWSYRFEPNYSKNSSLSHQIDLTKILLEWVTIDFLATIGKYVEWHNLQSWEFSSNMKVKVTHGSNNAKKIKTVIGLTVPCGVLIIGGIVIFPICWRKRKLKKEKMDAEGLIEFNNEFEKGVGPRRFSYMELPSATNNFSDERKLGEGGFGGVYKGYLIDSNMAVAGEFLLVYEFMPNGSLDSHLFGNKAPLSWSVGYKGALGLVSALLYLHEEWEQCVVHRDIKSSNVMLDLRFNVKLGDFGLARLMDHEFGGQTTGLAGTWGYLLPEYIST
ncbi:hypothetical protein Ancab_026204 [Ancistrocladus abbreviatus]